LLWLTLLKTILLPHESIGGVITCKPPSV